MELCREVPKGAEPPPKKVKPESGGALKARALDDDDMFKAKAPAARANAGGMPATTKKVCRIPSLLSPDAMAHRQSKLVQLMGVRGDVVTPREMARGT